jgi:hypothetical protein
MITAPLLRNELRLVAGLFHVLLVHAGFGQDRVDGWYEIDEVTAAVAASQALVDGRGNPAFHYDTVDRKAGDTSVVYRQRLSPRATKIGFTPYPFPVWELSAGMSIHLWLKIEGNDWDKEGRFRLSIRDQGDRGAHYNLAKAAFRGGDWVKLEIPLQAMEGIAGVNLRQLTELYLDTRLAADAVVRFDDVYFHNPARPGSVFGISDKTVRQRMLEARLSRNMRATTVYQGLAKAAKPPVMSDLWAQIWLGRDLGHVNAQLVRRLTTERALLDEQYGFADPWHLFATPWLIRMYQAFGPGDGPTSGRLTQAAADLILAVLWERTLEKNDIHWARARSPWYMDGSENHDLNMVVANYLSSQIFMTAPAYAERVLPNKGTGGGSAYWFHTAKGDIRFHGPYGGALLADGGSYVAKDHYAAWGTHLKAIIRERARKGFFLEQASPSYMKYTLGFLQDVYEFSDDPEMKELTRSLLDLVWATWAVETLHGQRGGAKTRDHLTLNVRSDSMYTMAKFLFGGMMGGGQAYYQLPAMDYELPEIVWQLALDRQALGEFAAVTRAIGEEPGVLPRRPGLERTLDLGAEHRMFRYAWVTPEYILGAQMDHPLAVHSHLSPTSRLHGLNFAKHPDARVFPYGVVRDATGNWKLQGRAGIMARTVQHRNVLISQQSRGYLQVNPEWYPQRSLRAERLGIYISPQVDRVEERGGWIFIEAGDAFAAVRIVEGVYNASDAAGESTAFVTYRASEPIHEPLREDSYEWNRERTLVVARDDFSPIIWDCSSRRHYPDLETFMRAVLANRLELIKTVVPGWYRLVYHGTGAEAATLHLNMANNEIPTINGQPLDYTPPQLFDSPFVQSTYNSGVIRLQAGALGHVIDFQTTE